MSGIAKQTGQQPGKGCTSHGASKPRDENVFSSIQPPSGRRRITLAQGTVIDRFRIERHLGSGSLADVYLAHDQTRGEDVAIKIVDAGPLGSEIAADQLRGELAAYSRVADHRHVLKVYDLHLIHWGGTQLLVLTMEYAEGGTLRTWLNQHANDPQSRRTQGLEYFEQLCLGAKAMHDAGVVHLDIKPENAPFVGGVLKIADFSVSAVIQSLTIHRTDTSRDDPGAVGLGTPSYMSREHFSACCREDLDARADIYSLGAVLFEIIHPKGRLPFSGNYERLRELHCSAPVPVLPGASQAQARVVARCLAKDPAARYQSVEELLDDLQGRAPVPQDPQSEAQGIDRLWQEACHLIENTDFYGAQRLCRQILEKAPEHRDAWALQEQLQERSQQAQQLYSAASQGMNSLNLDELITLVTEAEEVFPDHSSGHVVQVRLTLKAKQYRQAMVNGQACGGDGGFGAALSFFENARLVNPNSLPAQNAIRAVTEILDQIRQCRESIDRAIEAGDRARAETLAQSLDSYIDEMSLWIGKEHGGEGHEPDLQPRG